MKRPIALLLALLLLLCGIPWASARSVTLKLSVPDELPKAGESFEAALDITDNPGIFSAQLILTFDPAQMTCTQIELGDAVSGAAGAVNEAHPQGAAVAIASASALDAPGTLASFRFTAKDDITAWSFGLTNVGFSGADGDIEVTASLPVAAIEPPPRSGSASRGASVTEPGELLTSDDPSVPALTEISFSDVKPGDWYADWVRRAVAKGYFKGNPDGTFRPDTPITRVQFVTVLWRMAGEPVAQTEPPAELPFADMASQSEEFRSAVRWAYDTKVVTGVTATAFDPTAPLTREAAMTILHRFAGGSDNVPPMYAKIYDDTCTDSAEISAWAKTAVYWGIYNGIISGTSSTTLSPKATATRAQIAKILVGYNENLQKEDNQ